MLHEFLAANRLDLIQRCRVKVALRAAPKATSEELEYGIPIFLAQLIMTLQVEQSGDPLLSLNVSGRADGIPALSEVGKGAAQHGHELLKQGFTIDQVVHDYGDLCQAITDLAFETNARIETDEFRTLNRCLDNAIANAVTEYNFRRDSEVADKQAQQLNERLGFFAHELRNHIYTATLALSAIKSGHVGLTGATGAVLDRSLVGLTNLIDRSLTEVRMTAGLPVNKQLFSLADFIAEVRISASLEAQIRKCSLTVGAVDKELVIDGDRELLAAAVGNLLQNAFKFTHPGTQVTLNAYATGNHILIDIEDHCGGLPAGEAEKMFTPFKQSGKDKSGLGLGLSISRRSVEANGGILSVRDRPGTGCVFTVDLSRHSVLEVPAKPN